MDPQNNQQQNQAQHNAQDNNMVMSVLSYIGPLVIVSYFTAKDNPAVKFHVKQGLALFGIELIVYILGTMLWSLWTLLYLVNLCTLVLSIIGIINASQGKQKQLPVIGSFANNLKI